MPTKRGKDKKGCYYRWGNQKKYYYKCGDAKSRARAKRRADAQGRAIYGTGWRDK